MRFEEEEENEASLAGLTIRTSSPASSSSKKGKDLQTHNASDSSPSIKNSPFNSPSLVSPPSSAFVSALQSPYISPRATQPTITTTATTTTHKPSPVVSYKGSQSEDVPSSSYTPPSDQYEFSDDPSDRKLKLSACTPDPAPPRISFSFPVPRVSLAKVSVSSPATNTKLRSSDVFIGFHGQNPNLVRFCKWLKSELELQGIACFVADRAKYSDTQSHEIADRVICSVTYGIVVVSCSSLLNYLSLEEVRFFAQKKNLIPIFYGTGPSEIMGLLNCNAIDKECKEAIDGLIKSHEFKLEANESNWRSCVGKTATILRGKLGRKSVADKETVGGVDELPFPRNRYFLGREKEIIEMEMAFFGNGEYLESTTPSTKGEASGQSEGLADEESDVVSTRNGKFISLELGKCSEPRSEAWSDPNGGKNSLKRLLKTKKHRNSSSNCKGSTSVVCVNGVLGIGKTELALEFAYRHSQRYKMVLWVGGEARYFRQNLLNLSFSLGLDVSADAEKDRGRLRSFDEQEFEAFKRIKRELFRDMPYLLIIDNLEIEKDWWEGKDLNDLIPRNTGGTHVLITTRLPKVMAFDTVQLSAFPSSDAMVLLRGRRKKDYPDKEVEFLKLFEEKLGRLSYGLCVVGSLLSELAIPPSALFEAVNKVQIEERSASPFLNLNDEQQYCKSNPFVAKVLAFCLAVLEQAEGNRNLLSLKMLLVGAWFAPVPIPVNLLAAGAKNMPAGGNRFGKWNKCLSHTFAWCGGCGLGRRSEEDAAFLLVRLGLARITNRQPGCWIQFHPITQTFARRRDYILAPKATVQGVRKIEKPLLNLDHLWASAFLVFGFKSEPPLVQLQATDMVLYIKRTALPLAITAFTTFSRCNSALELLKVCTNVLEEVEKSFVSQIQDWRQGSLCWKKKTNKKVDEYVWQDVTLLKALLLETRAKLLLRGGHFDSGEELCRTCISIRTVMLGHNHDLTLAAQETLAKLVRMRSKI
uniref:TIR domain-containing protein n=1 Tax=Noccaea caerulescens TaxID=107243 RepID=A0A1J3DIG1_NOCCA